MSLFQKDYLFKHSIWLLGSMGIGHVCNMAYQMVVSRMLSPVEFALLASLLAVILMVSRPMSVLGTGMNYHVSLLAMEGRFGDIRRLLGKWLVLAGIPSLMVAAVAAACASPLTRLFHLERIAPILVMALSLPVLFVLPVVLGAVQGLQYFGWASAVSAVRGLLRVGLCAAFLIWIYPASGWALAGHVGSMYAAFFILLAFLLFRLRAPQDKTQPLPSMKIYLTQSLLVQAGYAVLMTADIVLVNHYFPKETDFSYSATLGRLVASIAVAIGMAMFPKVVTAGRETQHHRSLFLRSVWYCLLCTVPAMLVCLIVPGLLLHFIFGVKSATGGMIFYVRMMAVVMAFSSVLNIVVQYAVAQRRFMAVSPVILFACLYLLAAVLFPVSVPHIILFGLVANVLALVFSLIGLFWNQTERDAQLLNRK